MADEPPVQDPPIDRPPPPADEPQIEPPEDLPEAARESMRKANHQAAKYRHERNELRTRAEELETKLKAIEDSEKSELELAQQKAAELEQQQTSWQQERRETNLKLAVYSRQTELGITDADLALAALDRKAIDYDDTGEPTNIEEQLKELLERKPILKGTPQSPKPPDINGGAGANDTPPALTAEELEAAKKAGMTPERYAQMKGVGNLDDFERVEAERRRATTT